MIRCKKCQVIIRKPTARWEVIFSGDLIRNEGKWELEPRGENDYVDSLILECDSCGYEVKIKIEREEITDQHLEEAIKKFTNIEGG